MCGLYDLDGPDEAGECRARLWLEGQEASGRRAVLSWRGLRAGGMETDSWWGERAETTWKERQPSVNS